MSKLVIDDNKNCHLEEEPDIDFLWSLDRELLFDVPGAKLTRLYKGWVNSEGKFVCWDGKIKLLNEDLSFPIGLKQRVEEFYFKSNKQLEIVDNRKPETKSNKIDIYTILNNINKSPYNHQLEALEAAKNNRYGIIRAATGSGKTVLSAMIVAEFGKESIIFVVGKDLLYQTHDLFVKLFPNYKIGIIGDGKCEIGFINIVSVWTAGCALGINEEDILFDSEDEEENKIKSDKYSKIIETIKSAKIFIYDECHIAACNTIQEIFKIINPERIYGCSASPNRDDNSDLLIESVLGKIIIDIPASVLIKKGLLAKPIIKFINVPEMENVGKIYKSIYKNYIINNDIRNNLILDAAEDLINKGYKTLILYNNIKHGKILYDIVSKRISCVLLNGKDNLKTRVEARDKLVTGKIKCIIASRIFDQSIDCPELSGLIIAGSGKSSVRALQRIGRVIRKYNNKKHAAVVDFMDYAPYLKEHSKRRLAIYSLEEEFDIRCQKK